MSPRPSPDSASAVRGPASAASVPWLVGLRLPIVPIEVLQVGLGQLWVIPVDQHVLAVLSRSRVGVVERSQLSVPNRTTNKRTPNGGLCGSETSGVRDRQRAVHHGDDGLCLAVKVDWPPSNSCLRHGSWVHSCQRSRLSWGTISSCLPAGQHGDGHRQGQPLRFVAVLGQQGEIGANGPQHHVRDKWSFHGRKALALPPA